MSKIFLNIKYLLKISNEFNVIFLNEKPKALYSYLLIFVDLKK